MATPMTSEQFVQAAIPRLTGYYDHWSMMMENFLRSKELWTLVEDGVPTTARGTAASEGQRKSLEDAKLKDLKIKNFLFQAIDREIMETILDKGSAKAIWESMKQKYQGSTKVRRAQLQALRREFELLSMNEGEKVDRYISRTLAVVNKMKVHGEKIEQNVVVGKILRSMISKFNYIVCSIEESNDLDSMSIDELHGSLLVHEQRMQEYKEEDQALKIVHDGRPTRGRGRSSYTGRGIRGRGRGRERQQFNKELVECYKCHKLGHFQYECPEWEKGAHYAELDEEEEMLLMTQVELYNAKRDEVGLIDPALKGTLNVLRSCAKVHSIRRVVLTSSLAACIYSGKPLSHDVVVDETWHSDPAFCKELKAWYALSKTLAEEAARSFAKENATDLVIMNPSFVIGPLLQPTLNETVEMILNLVNGAETYPNASYRCIDVRDVANAHIQAFEIPSASGRYGLTANVTTISEVLKIIHENYPTLRLPEKSEETTYKPYQVSKEKAKTLGISFTPLDLTLVDTIESLREKGFLKI